MGIASLANAASQQVGVALISGLANPPIPAEIMDRQLGQLPCRLQLVIMGLGTTYERGRSYV